MLKAAPSYSKAIRLFKSSSGMMRTVQAIKFGINPKTLNELVKKGVLLKISRGLYRLADLNELTEPDISIVSSKIPRGVICLISALFFHKITTQIPHQVDIAIQKGYHKPSIDFPPIRVFRFSKDSFSEGVEIYDIDGVKVHVYNIAKTVADCFKFRNKIGLDIAVEALKNSLKSRKVKPADILKYTRIDKVEKVIMPYLETLI